MALQWATRLVLPLELASAILLEQPLEIQLELQLAL